MAYGRAPAAFLPPALRERGSGAKLREGGSADDDVPVFAVRLPQEPDLFRALPHPRLPGKRPLLLPDRDSHRLPRGVHQHLRDTERRGGRSLRQKALDDLLVPRLHRLVPRLRLISLFRRALPRHVRLRARRLVPHRHAQGDDIRVAADSGTRKRAHPRLRLHALVVEDRLGRLGRDRERVHLHGRALQRDIPPRRHPLRAQHRELHGIPHRTRGRARGGYENPGAFGDT